MAAFLAEKDPQWEALWHPCVELHPFYSYDRISEVTSGYPSKFQPKFVVLPPEESTEF